MLKIYIASPYSIGDTEQNVRFQIDIANVLMDKGYCPFAPLMAHYHHVIHPRPYEDWLRVDLQWVRQCDCLLRLGGESKGADREVQEAERYGIKVFYSIKDIDLWWQQTEEWYNSLL